MEDGTETPSENGSAISDVSQSGKDAIIAEEDSSGTREKLKCEVERISCLSLLSLSLPLSHYHSVLPGSSPGSAADPDVD